jgi:D-alanine-D-alanine ligase
VSPPADIVQGVTSTKPRVAVVFGGRSHEHAISCVSAGSVLAAIDRDQFEVIPVGITPEGGWVLTSGDPAELAIRDRTLPRVKDGSSVVLSGDPTSGGLIAVEPGAAVEALTGVDVVFPVLHGAYGEDGTIQGLLELAGLPYVGSGVFASAAAMDKVHTKTLLAAAGLPVGEYAVLRRGEGLPFDDRERLGLPVFVKPARAGSSIGISKVTDWADLDSAVALAREVDPKVLIEGAVAGREVECGVLEGEDWGPPEASVVAEIRLVGDHDWYDFEAKYLDDACEFDIPAGLPEDVSGRARELARQAFIALDCAGLARVDFFVQPDGGLVINEVNTMPGFTPISLFPRMWAASGIGYADLLTRLIRTALARGTGLR